MEKDKLEPKLRFPGFTEPWEQRELTCLIRLERGLTYKPEDIREDGIRVLRSSNIVGDSFILAYDDVFVDPRVVNIPFSEDGDILITAANGSSKLVGKHALIKGVKPETTVPGGFMFVGKTEYPDFVNALLSAPWYSRFIAKSTAGGNGAIGNLNKNSLMKTLIFKPSLSEMDCIGYMFSMIDSLITLHQRKEEELQKLKKGLLQKMFPKDGESVPEVRFPNFTNTWEHRKLATIATFAKGRGYSKNDLTDRGTPLILYGRLYTNYSSAIETVDTYAKPLIGSVYSKGGEVIVPASGETAEDIARASAVISKGFLLGGDLNIINPNSEIDPVFLALQLSNGYLKKELASKAQGKSVVHIHNSDLENLQIIYPSLVEQMKVSTCIRVFEHLITLHQRK